MCTNSLSNNTECGRVYINRSNTIEFRIKCLLCHNEFTTWQLFTEHIHSTHDSISRQFTLAQESYENENESQHKIAAHDQVINNTEVEELGLIDEPVEYVTGSIDEEVLSVASNGSSVGMFDHAAESHNNTNKEQIVNLVVEILPSCTERDAEDLHCDSFNEQSMSELVVEAAQKETINPDARCFFQLRTTDPSVMLGLIDIIRRHPCQWDPLDNDYAHKDRRDESLINICKELNELFQICVSPQLARSSILALIRWFEREYLRSVHLGAKVMSTRGRWCRNGYICAHPKYFEKLFEFLPHKHLQLVCCEICQRKFKTKNQLQVHNHQFHEGDAPFKCRYCKRSFLHASTWRHHENRHTKTRVWKCSLCSYITSAKTDYNLHMVTHTDTRAFICDLCGASYKSSTSLNVHVRTHDAPKLQCGICNKKFYENYRLKRHLMIHEAEEAVMQCDNDV